MTMEERKSNINTNIMQNIILENREKLCISGVNDVLSFDDLIVILETRFRFTYYKRGEPKNKQIEYR